MKVFEENKIYELELSKSESSVIYAFLTVNSYDRLYYEYTRNKINTAMDDKGREGSGKQLLFRESLIMLKKEDRLIDAIMMNQLALGLLLEHYVKCCGGHKSEEIRYLKLNSILLYELYITVCERIIAEENEYIAKNKGVNGLSQQQTDILNQEIKPLKDISKRLDKMIGLKKLKLMDNEYKKISIENHLNYCLQEF